MAETSIVIKAEDRYSDAVKAMSKYTKAFSKDVDALEDNLYQLSRNKTQLKIDAKQALNTLKEAEKQFAATGDAADGLKLELAQANYDNIRRDLNLVTRAAKDTEKQLQKVVMGGEGSGSLTSKLSGAKSVVNALASTGIGTMVSSLAQESANAWVTSALGNSGGNIVSSALSSGISGAAIGFMIAPGVGTAVGAAVGAGLGMLSGAVQNFENQDEAFKSYVQEAVEGQLNEMDTTLQTGSTIAGGREQNQLAFAQRFGSDAAARDYLDRVQTMAVQTNYGYDEIVGYSKLLLNSYGAEETLGVLKTLSDASAGLNLDSSDVNMFISGLSRMRTTNKATQEYLNYFSERGVDVYEALSRSTGADKSQIAGMVTRGEIGGAEAAQAILEYINETFGGLSDKLAGTYDAMVDNLADAQANLDAAMGEGYNEARKEGLQAQMDWLEGESGAKVEEAYQSIGAWKAELENQKEQYIRDAVDAAMDTQEYQDAKAAEDWATMGRLIQEARVQGQMEYNASDGAQELAESERILAEAVRDDAAANEAYWDAGYRLGQQFSRGRLAGASGAWTGKNGGTIVVTGKTFHYQKTSADNAGGYATGLARVPYDNFPALLHEGERVLTASEARNYHGGGNVTVTGNQFTVRQESDIDAIAAALLEQLQLARTAGVY